MSTDPSVALDEHGKRVLERLMKLADVDPVAVEVVLLITKESDRGAILVAASFADVLLERLLRSACISEKAADELLEHPGPLDRFSARITAAHALGLLPDDERWNADQLRKARNYCAHHIVEITLDDPKVAAHLDNMRVAADPDDDSPPSLSRKYKLASAIGSLLGWVGVATSELATQNPRRVITKLATKGQVVFRPR